MSECFLSRLDSNSCWQFLCLHLITTHKIPAHRHHFVALLFFSCLSNQSILKQLEPMHSLVGYLSNTLYQLGFTLEKHILLVYGFYSSSRISISIS